MSSLNNGAPHFNLANSFYFNGAFFDGYVNRPRQGILGAATYYTDIAGNSHSFKAGVDYQHLNSTSQFGYPNNQLFIDKLPVPAADRIGEEGSGFHQVMRGFDYNRVGIALACLGVAQVSLEETMAYVKERRAFGKTLATFEGVSFKIAEAATHIDACRGLCHRALWLADRGQPHTKESAMTKWWGPRLAVETIHQCLLFHGHYGYTDELPFEQRMRDVIGLEIGDGTAEVIRGDANAVSALLAQPVPDLPASKGKRGLTRRTPDRTDYETSVRAAKEHIRAGEAFQIVVAQRAERGMVPLASGPLGVVELPRPPRSFQRAERPLLQGVAERITWETVVTTLLAG